MRIVNYGGGTNSTALLIEMHTRGISVDAIVFADTGSEFPHTYDYIEVFSDWLQAHGMPRVTVVKWIRKMAPFAGEFISLDAWCESDARVPSRAYGMSGCTSKWKQQPADKYIRDLVGDGMAERWIGYDADEPQRAARMLEKSPEPERFTWHAPLIDWDMGRDECVAVIEAAGLPQPGKSSCWMCPSMRKSEILQLRDKYPVLLKRALAMEQAALDAGNLGSNKRRGLGGRLNWADFLATGAGINPEGPACGCYDGEQMELFPSE